MDFDTWWNSCVSPEAKRDIETYYELSRDKVLKLAQEAGIEMSSDVDFRIYSEAINSLKNPGLKFFFEWVDGKQQKTLFQKDLGMFSVTDDGFLARKEQQ